MLIKEEKLEHYHPENGLKTAKKIVFLQKSYYGQRERKRRY